MANYVSDVGGIVGLWVGCSVLSIFEFLELAMDCLLWFITNMFYKFKDRRAAAAAADTPDDSSRKHCIDGIDATDDDKSPVIARGSIGESGGGSELGADGSTWQNNGGFDLSSPSSSQSSPRPLLTSVGGMTSTNVNGQTTSTVDNKRHSDSLANGPFKFV